MGYLYVLGCVAFTVYGQIILKWRVSQLNIESEQSINLFRRLFTMLFDPVVMSALIAAFVASLFWMAALTKLDVSTAYPLMSAALPIVLLLSIVFLGESYSHSKIVGATIILLGVSIVSRG